ncbi:MAG TPA: tetratricopeptide repeat protein [Gemmataceae bacterium]|nr:tetratricopeptide repeat protein [Gemmataceae bacterium]
MAKAAIASLARRAEGSLRAGRHAEALQFAKQRARDVPGPEALDLLKRCYLAAAAPIVERGNFREAHGLLNDAEQLVVNEPAWLEKLAELRADLGDHGQALRLLEKVPGTTARPRILGHIVDRAIREGPGGKDLLPADLRPGFELVRIAFADYQAGRDEPAREALSSIGLSSPYLEWKLLLRGLIAWTANDTPRALENWSRLSSDRLPARLAAPFRMSVDKSFAATLPANRVPIVAQQADQLAGGMNETLRRLRKQLANEDMIPAALETARVLAPEMKRLVPDLVPRLASAIYWSLLSGGQPEDLPRYNRIFGPPTDDPQFYRLQALVMEQMGRLDMAHGFWAKYEEWIAKTPNRWPGDQANRARALVLERMGRLARDWIDNEGDDEEDDFDDFFSFFDRNVRRGKPARKPLKPSAETCFQRAGELAPDWPAPALEMLRELDGKPDKAVAMTDQLLTRFPNHLPILEAAARLYESLGEMVKAHEVLKRALAANPLDRELRQQAARLSLNAARRLAETGDFEAARAGLREAGDLAGGSQSLAVIAIQAAIELRAGDLAAFQTHRDLLLNAPNAKLAGAYRIMVEGSRLKLKKPVLGPYQTAFADGLAGPVSVSELIALLEALDQYRQEPVPYRGLKTQEKKIVERVMAATTGDLNEDDLVRLGLSLKRSKSWKALRHLGEQAHYRFQLNAFFPFFMAEAIQSKSRTDRVNVNAGRLYMRTKQLIDDAEDGHYRRVQELLDERLKLTPDLKFWFHRELDW